MRPFGSSSILYYTLVLEITNKQINQKNMLQMATVSLSSSFLPSPLPTTRATTAQTLRRLLIISSTHSSTTLNSPKKKHWKIGEYPGVTETSTSQFSSTNKNKRTPIKNIKKKLDRKDNAKGWANTVTEALSEAIDKKQWLRALQVYPIIYLLQFNCSFRLFCTLLSVSFLLHFIFIITCCNKSVKLSSPLNV